MALWRVAGCFAANIDKGMPSYCLTLSGASGCGKTHLATEIEQWVKKYKEGYKCPRLGIWQRREICKIKAIELASQLRAGDRSRTHYLKKDVFLLVIDDLGAEMASEFIASEWAGLIDARENLWTVITTNLSLDELSQSLDARIASRLNRGRNLFFHSKAMDYYARKQAQEQQIRLSSGFLTNHSNQTKTKA